MVEPITMKLVYCKWFSRILYINKKKTKKTTESTCDEFDPEFKSSYEEQSKTLIEQSYNESGPSCSKLTMSLANDSLKFTSTDTQICWNLLLKKMWVAFADFQQKCQNIVYLIR